VAVVSLVGLVLFTGTFQQALDHYARELANKAALEPADSATKNAYDDNGNRTADGTSSYFWDWNNRLISATVSGTTVTYTYAGDGLRASRTVSAVTTEYLWDRETGLPEIVDDGTRITVQTPIGTLGQFDASTGDGTYPLHDALGTARVQTDDGGTVVGTADYDVYGNLRASSGTQATEGWTGETRDTTTGLTYLRARDYEPRAGRFISADTESPNGSLTQGFNPYHYTGNNPTTRTDPSGHNWIQHALVAVGQVSDVIVQMVYLMRDFMRNDDIPPVVRKFIGALISFGIAIMSMLLQTILLNLVISAAGGLLRSAIGGAIMLSRMRVFAVQGQRVIQCIKAGMCQKIGLFLVRNGDCFVESLQFAAHYRSSGVPNLTSGSGAIGVIADSASLAEACGTRGRDIVGPTGVTRRPGDHEMVDLTTPDRRDHILSGEVRSDGSFGGGHRAGTNYPGKSEFPAEWSDDLIIHYISDIATDPFAIISNTTSNGGVFYRGWREGVEIEVLVRNGRIITGYPVSIPRNSKK
jgi:RHS repeat-associated protein